jgi:hypothetical protein
MRFSTPAVMAGSGDGKRKSLEMKGVLVAAILLAATVGAATPARAGVVGDAIVAVGAWIGEVEETLSDWAGRLWKRVASSNTEARAADAFRRLLVEAPERLDALAGRAGYALAGYDVAVGDRRDLLLRFRHDRDLDSGERGLLARELQDPATLDIRPELTLLRLLMDASDWRDASASGRFRMTGVEVQVDDTVSSRLLFTEPTVAR